MKELLNEVNDSIAKEYNRARDKFGPVNHSAHESYAVILEEFEEANNEADAFEINLRNFWYGVKINTVTKCQLRQMADIATHAAAEWIQVAAMCRKADISIM